MTEETALKIPTKPPMGGLNKGLLSNKANFDHQMKSIDPKTVPHRIGLVIDDSSSMGLDGMANAHKAVKGFTGNCSMQDTSIAAYPLNRDCYHLICDYDLINLYVQDLGPSGSTPIYTRLEKLITDEPITRAVVFSDGSPTDSKLVNFDDGPYSWGISDKALAIRVVGLYKEKEIPVDTIFIGFENSAGYNEMKKLAEVTNGTFIHFRDSNSLASGLKYLAPKYRALLANPEIKAKIERGETV